MATKTIDQLNSASTLTGTEVLPIVQSNQTLKTTVQDIANLAGGFMNISIPLSWDNIIYDEEYSYYTLNEENLFYGIGLDLTNQTVITNLQISFYEDFDGIIYLGQQGIQALPA